MGSDIEDIELCFIRPDGDADAESSLDETVAQFFETKFDEFDVGNPMHRTLQFASRGGAGGGGGWVAKKIRKSLAYVSSASYSSSSKPGAAADGARAKADL